MKIWVERKEKEVKSSREKEEISDYLAFSVVEKKQNENNDNDKEE